MSETARASGEGQLGLCDGLLGAGKKGSGSESSRLVRQAREDQGPAVNPHSQSLDAPNLPALPEKDAHSAAIYFLARCPLLLCCSSSDRRAESQRIECAALSRARSRRQTPDWLAAAVAQRGWRSRHRGGLHAPLPHLAPSLLRACEHAIRGARQGVCQFQLPSCFEPAARSNARRGRGNMPQCITYLGAGDAVKRPFGR